MRSAIAARDAGRITFIRLIGQMLRRAALRLNQLGPEMDQPVLTDLFVVEVEQLPSVAKECQREGREKGKEHADRIWRLMSWAYHFHGPKTDAEMAQLLGIERSTVNARRNEHAEVVPFGSKKNEKSGVNNTLWGIR